MVVDGLKLVRQGIHAGNGQREVRVVLVGKSQPQRLDTQPKPGRIEVKRALVGTGIKTGQLAGIKDRLVDATRIEPLPHKPDRVSKRSADNHLHRLGKDCASHNRSRLRHLNRHWSVPPSSPFPQDCIARSPIF